MLLSSTGQPGAAEKPAFYAKRPKSEGPAENLQSFELFVRNTDIVEDIYIVILTSSAPAYCN
jgi:hypothetical protein